MQAFLHIRRQVPSPAAIRSGDVAVAIQRAGGKSAVGQMFRAAASIDGDQRVGRRHVDVVFAALLAVARPKRPACRSSSASRTKLLELPIAQAALASTLR